MHPGKNNTGTHKTVGSKVVNAVQVSGCGVTGELYESRKGHGTVENRRPSTASWDRIILIRMMAFHISPLPFLFVPFFFFFKVQSEGP